jgi:hypothetical protein
MLKTWLKRTGFAFLVILLGLFLGRSAILRHFEPTFLTTGPNGPETPAAVGLALERIQIPSSGGALDGYLVEAAPDCQPRTAVLIFHGVMETISEWVKAQRFLYDHCISSVVFDYSGRGDGTRPGTIPHLSQDSSAAYSWFAARFAGEKDIRLCTLGHSMGNGTMLEAAPSFRPAPACIVVANAFCSLRDEGGITLHGPLKLLLYLMPE